MPDFLTEIDVIRAAKNYCNLHVSFEFGLESSSDVFIQQIRRDRPEVDKAWVEMFDAYLKKWED